uniref:Amyloid beta (A4) precursor protein-binding, family A, member 1b n=1 Tax=Amphilophus citrinellus TaxID=61819 RepID=A0A3Q0SQ14_AMPCI
MLNQDGELNPHHHHHHPPHHHHQHHHHHPPGGRGPPRHRRRPPSGQGQGQSQALSPGPAPAVVSSRPGGGESQDADPRPVQQPRPAVTRYRRHGDPNPRLRSHRHRQPFREIQDSSPGIEEREGPSQVQVQECTTADPVMDQSQDRECSHQAPVAVVIPTHLSPGAAPPEVQLDPPNSPPDDAEEDLQERKMEFKQESEEVKEDNGKQEQVGDNDGDCHPGVGYSSCGHDDKAEEYAERVEEDEERVMDNIEEDPSAQGSEITDLCSDTESAASLSMDGPLHSPPPLQSPTPPSSPDVPAFPQLDHFGEDTSMSPLPDNDLLPEEEEDEDCSESCSLSHSTSCSESYPKTYADFYTESHQKSYSEPVYASYSDSKPYPNSFPEPLKTSYPEPTREPRRQSGQRTEYLFECILMCMQCLCACVPNKCILLIAVPGPCDPEDLIDGIIFAATYLGCTHLLSERTPTKSARMQQAQEAMSRVRVRARFILPDDEAPSTAEVDLFMSTQRIKVLNADTQECLMDLPLRTISYIADIGNMVVLMARGKMVRSRSAQENLDHTGEQTTITHDDRRMYRMICHVFESEDAQLIAQSIGQSFSVAYQEFLRANGIDPEDLSQREYSDLLNTQDMYNDDLIHFSKSENCRDLYIEKQKGEILGVVIVESGWGSILPTVIIASMMHAGPAEKSGRLNIGDQIMTINGTSLVGLPLSTCQSIIKGLKSQSRIKMNIVRCPPVTMVLIRRPDLRYQLGFSVQNGIICSLMRGGIAERGGVRVGHRIIEINSQSVVATPHEKIVQILSNAMGEIHMKTMPAAMYRLLTAQEQPVYI